MEIIETIFGSIVFIGIFIVFSLAAGIPVYAIYSSFIFKKRAAMYSSPNEYNKKYRSTKEKLIDLIVWGGSGFLTICFLYGLLIHSVVGIGIWKGHTPKIYERAVVHGNGYIALPPNTEDLRVHGENWVRGAYSAAAFTLHGNDYDEFINAIDKKYNIYGDKPSYEEYNFTGKTVGETIDYYNAKENILGLDISSRHIKYVKVDNIRQYTVLYYDFDTTETHLIATNPKTGRFVIYNGGYD